MCCEEDRPSHERKNLVWTSNRERQQHSFRALRSHKFTIFRSIEGRVRYTRITG